MHQENIKRAIVLLSGGIDSTTTLAVAKGGGYEVYAITFDYGQRHSVELNSAKRCAEYFSVKKHLVIKFDLREIGGSALTSDIEVPKGRIQDSGRSDSQRRLASRYRIQDRKNHVSCIVHHESSLSIPVTYVPARNTIFLSFALAWAESIGAEDIFIGANAVDYSGYPDCRPDFISAFENMANYATKAAVEGESRFKIHAPLINLTKAQIIKRGIELGVDFSLTWSCYDPQEVKRHGDTEIRRHGETETGIFPESPGPRVPESFIYVPCKRCDSCLLRAKGFREAGIKDPLA